MKVAIGATGAVVGCCALHLGISAIVAGAVSSWPIAMLGAVVAVAIVARHRPSGCDVVSDLASALPAVEERRR